MGELSIVDVEAPQKYTRDGIEGMLRRARVLPLNRWVNLFWSDHNNQLRQSKFKDNCQITKAVLTKAVNRAYNSGELDLKLEVPWIDICESDFG